MAQAATSIEVPLPKDVQPSRLDLELLRATFQAMVALRLEGGREWQEVLCQLERDGWTVNWGLCWHAEAKRGEDYEKVSGRTLDVTFSELAQLARLDMVGHCP
jgi:hypothetical protein